MPHISLVLLPDNNLAKRRISDLSPLAAVNGFVRPLFTPVSYMVPCTHTASRSVHPQIGVTNAQRDQTMLRSTSVAICLHLIFTARRYAVAVEAH